MTVQVGEHRFTLPRTYCIAIIHRYLRYLIEYDNPVSQIAGLNLLLAMLSLGLSEKILPATVVDDSYRMLLNIAYPNKKNR